MAKNIFSKQNQPDFRPNRNTFDLSKQNVFTGRFGYLYPVYCKDVIPGDSFNIKSLLAVQGLPTVFPIQTRVKAYVHYFYVRNRTLMKNWQDYIFNTSSDEIVAPYISCTSEDAFQRMFLTGKLGDHLGIPSVHYANQWVSYSFPTQILPSTPTVGVDYPYSYHAIYTSDTIPVGYRISQLNTVYEPVSVPANGRYGLLLTLSKDVVGTNLRLNVGSSSNTYVVCYNGLAYSSGQTSNVISFGFTGELEEFKNRVSSVQLLILRYAGTSSFTYDPQTFISSLAPLTGQIYLPSMQQDTVLTSPFSGINPKIPLSALPFRAYEMIYNYFYRNELNDPYILNGKVEYNKFIPTDGDGADTNVYELHKRNWELDRFTSAVQSPQYGEAPLVGITYKAGQDTATLTFRKDANDVTVDAPDVEEGNVFEVEVDLDDNGRIKGIYNAPADTPSGSLRNVMDLATAGISINDLRNVNAFQRFLENTLRRGLRYRNQLKSHFGVNVDYPDIDVPQFIGGYSGFLQVQKNVAQSADGLGDFNGSLGGVIQAEHSINCYCPEHGFIMAIASFVPIPTYSQTLDSMFLKHNYLDYFNTEFSKIGYVPIRQAELSPLQVSDPDTVFGYQRAWYDYISDFDTVHGDFRTNLRDFVLTRQFSDSPELGPDFTKVSDDQLNDIWAAADIIDKYGSQDRFLCQFYSVVNAKRPIPRYGTPSLE